MKFDLFDAMKIMDSKFGSDGRILLSQELMGVKVRLSKFKEGEIFNYEFAVTREEIASDVYVDILNDKFQSAVAALERMS